MSLAELFKLIPEHQPRQRVLSVDVYTSAADAPIIDDPEVLVRFVRSPVTKRLVAVLEKRFVSDDCENSTINAVSIHEVINPVDGSIRIRVIGELGKGMQIFVKMLSGKTHSIRCAASDTVDGLRELLACVESTPANHLRLIFGGRQLEGRRLLSEYGIQNESTVHVTLRCRGGMMHVSSGRGDYSSVTQRDQEGELCHVQVEINSGRPPLVFYVPMGTAAAHIEEIVNIEVDNDYCRGHSAEILPVLAARGLMDCLSREALLRLASLITS